MLYWAWPQTSGAKARGTGPGTATQHIDSGTPLSIEEVLAAARAAALQDRTQLSPDGAPVQPQQSRTSTAMMPDSGKENPSSRRTIYNG